ncbi:Kinesin-associated protein 3, partial [Cladochytrium tenue]
CFHLLLNLAEDTSIEVKMVKRGIVQYLLVLLSRKTPELLILVLTFLKKLSIFKENKDDMTLNMNDLLSKLYRIITTENQPTEMFVHNFKKGIQSLILRLLLNLSHDQAFRAGLVRHSFVPRLFELLNSKTNLVLALQLLYQISIDDPGKVAFSTLDAVGLLMKMILEYKGERVNIELMAVAVNVAANRRCAEFVCEDNGLKFLVRRALKTKDALLLKMVRNVALHQGDVKLLFLDHIDDLMHLLQKSLTQPDILVELLGTLASLTIPEFDFAKLAEVYGLLDMLQKRLAMAVAAAATSAKAAGGARPATAATPSAVGLAEDDDVTLEVVALLATMAIDENVAPMVARTDVIALLIDLMIAKEDDDEMVLQIIYCIYQFLLHEGTRDVLINQTRE